MNTYYYNEQFFLTYRLFLTSIDHGNINDNMFYFDKYKLVHNNIH